MSSDVHDDVVVAEGMSPEHSEDLTECFEVRTYRPLLEEFQFARTELLDSTIHGKGLFVAEDIRRGGFIVEYEGDVFSLDVADIF